MGYWDTDEAKKRDAARVRAAEERRAAQASRRPTRGGPGDFCDMVDKNYDWMGYADNLTKKK